MVERKFLSLRQIKKRFPSQLEEISGMSALISRNEEGKIVYVVPGFGKPLEQQKNNTSKVVEPDK